MDPQEQTEQELKAELELHYGGRDTETYASAMKVNSRFLIGRICWFVVCGAGAIGCFGYLIGYVLVGNYYPALAAGVLASLCAFGCYAIVWSILERHRKNSDGASPRQ